MPSLLLKANIYERMMRSIEFGLIEMNIKIINNNKDELRKLGKGGH